MQRRRTEAAGVVPRLAAVARAAKAHSAARRYATASKHPDGDTAEYQPQADPADTVLRGVNHGVIVHLPAMREHDRAAQPVEKDVAHAPQRLRMGVKANNRG